jgi:hypothetical protein
MRTYKSILWVAGLTVAMIAAGVAWERFYITPLVEQAQQKPATPDAAPPGELPPECLEELARMASAATAADPRPSLASKAAPGEPLPETGNVLRPGGGAKQSTMRIQVTDSSQAPAAIGDDASARPIQHAQSAEYNEPAPRPAANPRTATGTLPVSVQESRPLSDLAGGLKSVDVLDLMRRLRADDDQRAEASRELLRRGFSEVDLELARQLFSPDVEARKQLARSVPRLSSVDAAKWLMWLALDPQPEVRSAALTTLATTGDPVLLDRVEALARSDRDPQIQLLADQIARQRNLASSRGDPTTGGANPMR